MFGLDRVKKTFMTEHANYRYNFMSFELKIDGTTYQRMMNNIFQEEIRKAPKVYMDDMIVIFER